MEGALDAPPYPGRDSQRDSARLSSCAARQSRRYGCCDRGIHIRFDLRRSSTNSSIALTFVTKRWIVIYASLTFKIRFLFYSKGGYMRRFIGLSLIAGCVLSLAVAQTAAAQASGSEVIIPQSSIERPADFG